MTTSSPLLSALSRDDLLVIVDHCALEVTDRRAKAGLAAAVAGIKESKLSEALGTFSRDRLKELCGVLELDDSGREKSVLVGRLVATTKEAKAPRAAAKSEPPPKSKSPASVPPDSAAVVGFEAKLWLMADKLRNNMDAAEYKHVVLGLMA